MPYIPMAMPCSSGGKVSRRMAWETIMRTPPPTPWSTRKPTMRGSVRATPHSMDETVKRTRLKI
jgi:hypothetical protein